MTEGAWSGGAAFGELEPVVLDGSLERVDRRWRYQLGVAVGGEGDFPVLSVGLEVVEGAEQGAVGEVGGSAGLPFPAVVAVAVGGWPVAAGGDAAAVPDGDCVELAGAELAGGAAEVEGDGVAAEGGGDDAGVAGEPPELRCGEGAAGGQQRDPVGGVLEVLEVGGDHDLDVHVLG